MRCFGVVMIAIGMMWIAAGRVSAANLLVNGDFEQGNVGFTTNYTYYEWGTWPGRYSIKTDPHLWDGGYESFGDHTSGSGNMLLVDAAGPAGGTAGQSCWDQHVEVSPNTTYVFSAWMAKITRAVGSMLEIDINGVSQGQFMGPSEPAIWQRILVVWNSGSEESAVITVREVTGVTWIAGNDFALDDLSFFIPTPGDADRDDCVNYVDFALMAGHWGDGLVTPAKWEEGNFNTDTLVDFNDLLLMAYYWLEGCEAL
jgi:hypothetical protein